MLQHGLGPGGPRTPTDARLLLDAVLSLSSDLSLHGLLQRIVSSSCGLTGARHGLLAVVDAEGAVDDYVGHGLSAGRAADLLAHPADDPGPDGARVLQVPVRVRGTIFGWLYLAAKAKGDDFTSEDESLVDALARVAGTMVDHARTFQRGERDRVWLEAAADVEEALRAGDGGWDGVATAAVRAAGARWGAVLGVEEAGVEVVALEGEEAADVAALLGEVEHPLRRADESGEVVTVTHGEAPVLLVPLRARLADRGVLLLAWEPGRRRPEEDEVARVVGFAESVALGLDRTQALLERQQLVLLADRERIARDLHDLVIQRLFATGLQLQGARHLVDDAVRARLDDAAGDLDLTIRDIRSTIFELQHRRGPSIRTDLQGLVHEYVPVLGFTPLLRTAGPVDHGMPDHLGDQLLATLREALSNVARHARADACVVEVGLADGWLTLSVTDNGTGIPAQAPESGLRNARHRATDLGGWLTLCPAEPHGTRLEWRVPVGPGDA